MRIFILSAALLVLGTGCSKDFFDINDNPNDPTDKSITPELILPNALHASAAKMATSYEFAARWMGYWTRSGSYGPSTEEESYNITTTFEQNEWSNSPANTGTNGWYNTLNDLHVMEKKAAEANQTIYQAMAKILKTIGFMYLVDQYNNVPYSQAFDLGKYILPAYDNGQDIYNSLLAELTTAKELLRNGVPGNNPGLSDADIMFHGNIDMWRRFANTQHLKLLIRQSQIPGFDPSAELAKISADGTGFLGHDETANVQPGYMADNGKQNPFWNAYELLYTGDAADAFNRANNYVLNLYRNNNDVRYQYVFDPAIQPLNGNVYFGYDYGFVDPDPNVPKAANSSGVGGPGLARSASQPQWFFTSVESMFLQAEAIQRGWIAGDAETAYRDAVRESFHWLGVTDAFQVADAYLDAGHAVADWNQATGMDEKIKLIVLQKYLALTGINNFEAWVDYRRLGVPNVPRSLSPSVGPNIPLRLRYPQNEYNYNSANVAKQGNPDHFTSPVFWDR